ncbi:hypothetical protein CLOM_g15717 [Closterium sp. NIES-68]|nr:hypothetical protein CLOM_g15717 [Closterium sp. NIES-68]
MNKVFRSLLDKCVIVYLDDIVVYNTIREQHLKDLEAVFTLYDQHRLIIKGSKCGFLKAEPEFLGHVISTEGVKIDQKRIHTVRNWEPPTNVKQLQCFMGFINYVHRFIPKMAESTAPLTDVLQKGVFYVWGERQQAAFDQLKTFLMTSPVLHIADPGRPYELVMDAKDIAVGTVLLQDFGKGLQPIAYNSQKLQGTERITQFTTRKFSRSSRPGTATYQRARKLTAPPAQGRSSNRAHAKFPRSFSSVKSRE